MNKTLLVLAASIYQLPTIITAKRLGYRVITTDNVPHNPGHAIADKCYYVDTTKKKEVLKIAMRENISGVISPCTDISVPTAAFISEKLGIKGIPFQSANIFCDKVAFAGFLKKNAFSSPASFSIDDHFAPPGNLFNKPWILKPDRSSGSKGIFVINSFDEYRQRLPETLGFSPNHRGILQEFISGFQGTCEGILSNGELANVFFLDRQTADLPYVVTTGHHMPTMLSSSVQNKIAATIKKMCSIFKIVEGPFDCDFVAADDEVYILEITARMGGNSIATLLKKSAKFDLIEYSIKQAIGEPVVLPKKVSLQPTAVILLGVSEEGRLEYNREQAEKLKKESWVDSLEWDVEFGQNVLPFINGRYRVGQVFIRGKDRADVDTKVKEFKRRLGLRAV